MPDLEERLQAGRWQERLKAAQELEDTGDKDLISRLIRERLTDRSCRLRTKAVEIIGRTEGASAIPVYMEALNDLDDEVRWMAARVLAGLGETALPALVKGLREGGEKIFNIAWVLEKIENNDPGSIDLNDIKEAFIDATKNGNATESESAYVYRNIVNAVSLMKVKIDMPGELLRPRSKPPKLFRKRRIGHA